MVRRYILPLHGNDPSCRVRPAYTTSVPKSRSLSTETKGPANDLKVPAGMRVTLTFLNLGQQPNLPCKEPQSGLAELEGLPDNYLALIRRPRTIFSLILLVMASLLGLREPRSEVLVVKPRSTSEKVHKSFGSTSGLVMSSTKKAL